MHLVLDTRWIFDAISGFDSVIVPYGPNSLANQRRLPGDLAKIVGSNGGGDALYHGTNYMLPLFGRMPRTIITVHDLIPLMVPNYAPRSKKSKIPFLFPAVLRRCVRRADAVVAVSENTKRDIRAKLGVADDKVRVIYNGIFSGGENSGDAPGSGDGTLARMAPFVLSVGRRDPYKNLVLLVEAFAELVQSDPALAAAESLQLRVIGPEDPRYPEAPARVRELGLADRVHFLGSVDDATLRHHYREASLLAFPSLYEGFGLPVLEAMASGTPVVCARSSSLPEVAGDAAVFVPPNDRSALVSGMALVLNDPERRNSFIASGLEQARRFSWSAAAEQLAALYHEIAAE